MNIDRGETASSSAPSPGDPGGAQRQDVPRVAVVAVHGVADQAPGATARATADLLLREAPAGVSYSAVAEGQLRIGVLPLKGTPPEKREGWRRFLRWLKLDERPQAIRSRDVARRQAAGELAADLDAEERRLEHELMAEQLGGYEPPEADGVYETLRLESTRRQDGQARRVDVYEMYWADLSRLGHRWIGVLFDLYQLLFFVVKIGRKNLDSALHSIEIGLGRISRWWRFTRWCQNWAERILTLFVPVLNLAILGVASVLVVRYVPEAVPVWLPAAILLGLLSATGIYLRRERLANRGHGWPWLVLVPLLVAGTVGWGLRSRWPVEIHRPEVAALLWLVAAALIFWLMAAYGRRRSGAKRVALLALLYMSWIYLRRLRSLGADGDWNGVFDAALASAKDLVPWLHLVWPLFTILALAAIVAGMVAAVRARAEPALGSRSKRLYRAAGTAAITLVIPGLLVLLLNVALWQALTYLAGTVKVELGSRVFVLSEAAEAEAVQEMVDEAEELDLDSRTLRLLDPAEAKAVQKLVDEAFLPGFGWGLSGLGLAFVLALWALLPSIRAEGGRPDRGLERSRWLGSSLSAAFSSGLRLGGVVLLALMGAVFASMVLMGLERAGFDTPVANVPPSDLIKWLVAGVGLALVVGVAGSRGPFRIFAAGLRSALDVALDVANWLRAKPQDATPRARICARYAALLRHLCEWRDPAEPTRGYDRIVILAHSQGTVITADLLRYLKREIDSGGCATASGALECLFRDQAAGQLGRLPIYFFTVGSPLRQLYSRRLPFHYGWARHQSDLSWPNAEPDPAELGVALWSNGYASGDYIGRYLWHAGTGEERWQPSGGGAAIVHRSSQRRELCVGAGAHTAYWRQPPVAEELDWLIAQAGAASCT